MHLSLVLFFSVTYIVVTCQDCKVGGIKCADHEQCCGGCCFNGECVDTYRSCLKDLNVCKDHVCRGEENCFSYRPLWCLGCEPIPLCKLTPGEGNPYGHQGGATGSAGLLAAKIHHLLRHLPKYKSTI